MKTTPPDDAEALHFLDSRVIVRRSGLSQADRVSVMEHYMPYGSSPPWHVHHHEDEVFHIIEGRIRFHVGERELMARSGETLVAPKGVPHSFRVESPSGARCLTIVTGPGFEALVRAVSQPARTGGLPQEFSPTPELLDRLGRAAVCNGIEILAP